MRHSEKKFQGEGGFNLKGQTGSLILTGSSFSQTCICLPDVGGGALAFWVRRHIVILSVRQRPQENHQDPNIVVQTP